MKNSYKQMIRALGGATAVATGISALRARRGLDAVSVDTVKHWVKRDSIPGEYWQDFSDFAATVGTAISVPKLHMMYWRRKRGRRQEPHAA